MLDSTTHGCTPIQNATLPDWATGGPYQTPRAFMIGVRPVHATIAKRGDMPAHMEAWDLTWRGNTAVYMFADSLTICRKAIRALKD
jgi:hypothetical protein